MSPGAWFGSCGGAASCSLLTHIALSLVEEYQTLPLISPQEAVASGDVPLIENAFNRYRQDLLSAIDTMMVVQEPYTQDA